MQAEQLYVFRTPGNILITPEGVLPMHRSKMVFLGFLYGFVEPDYHFCVFMLLVLHSHVFFCSFYCKE